VEECDSVSPESRRHYGCPTAAPGVAVDCIASLRDMHETDTHTMFSSAGFPAATGRQVQLRVRRRAGMEAEDVLGTGSGMSVWGKLFGGKQGAITHLLPSLSLRHLQVVLRGLSAPPCTPCNPPAPLVFLLCCVTGAGRPALMQLYSAQMFCGLQMRWRIRRTTGCTFRSGCT